MGHFITQMNLAKILHLLNQINRIKNKSYEKIKYHHSNIALGGICVFTVKFKGTRQAESAGSQE
jgi:hypothetical protein